MFRAIEWAIGIAVVVGLHVVLIGEEMFMILVFLWAVAGLVWAEHTRQKLQAKIDRLEQGSWIDQHHEHLEEFRAEHEERRASRPAPPPPRRAPPPRRRTAGRASAPWSGRGWNRPRP